MQLAGGWAYLRVCATRQQTQIGMAEITTEIIGTAGVITLDKPETLNALTQDMVRVIARDIERWRDDPRVRHVIVRASGGRAFSAGGDIRNLYVRGRSHYDATLEFFAEEYRLNVAIREYPKPYIALIDGIVMGGGVGVSVNGQYRVGTENTRFAMPEVGIGFFPDVGGTWFLPRFPGRYGHYCALTGARLKQEEAVATGVLTHLIGSDALAALFDVLTETEDAVACLAEKCDDPSRKRSLPNQGTIDECFDEETVEGILRRLETASGEDGVFRAATAATLRSKSPTSLKIALRQMQVGAAATFRDCMKTEYRIVSHVLKGVDFYEGVRATIIDKDNAPQWHPSRIEDINASDVDIYFDVPEAGDLTFA